MSDKFIAVRDAMSASGRPYWVVLVGRPDTVKHRFRTKREAMAFAHEKRMEGKQR